MVMDRSQFDKLGVPFEKQWENEKGKPVDINEKAAEILVKCGYSDTESGYRTTQMIVVELNPFADTLEGRRQADYIENWLSYFHTEMWLGDQHIARENNHQWRLDRIKWCLQELIK